MAMDFSVTFGGTALDPKLYTWDEKTKTFSTDEECLVLDFLGCDGVKFRTGRNCIFKAGRNCVFDTGSYCVFVTGRGCVFTTGGECTFNTNSDCVFNNIGVRCVLVRHDTFETYILPKETSIKLNGFLIPGYEIVPKEETKEEILAKIVQKLKTCDIEKLKRFLELEN